MKYVKKNHYDINHQPCSVLNSCTPVLLAVQGPWCKDEEARVKRCWQQMTCPDDCGLSRLELLLLTWVLVGEKLGVSAPMSSGIDQKEPLMDKGGRTLRPVSCCASLAVITTPSAVSTPASLVCYRVPQLGYCSMFTQC